MDLAARRALGNEDAGGAVGDGAIPTARASGYFQSGRSYFIRRHPARLVPILQFSIRNLQWNPLPHQISFSTTRTKRPPRRFPTPASRCIPFILHPSSLILPESLLSRRAILVSLPTIVQAIELSHSVIVETKARMARRSSLSGEMPTAKPGQSGRCGLRTRVYRVA
jgi:hypothetical protein